MEPNLLRFLLLRCAIGVGTGWSVLAAFIALDVASLRTLMQQTDATWPALILLGVFFAITFGSCAMGLGIMFHDKDDPKGPGGGHRIRLPRLPAAGSALPARARART